MSEHEPFDIDGDSFLAHLPQMASSALVAVRAFAHITGLTLEGKDGELVDGYETVIAYLLGDLMHLCDILKLDFADLEHRAHNRYYVNEVANAAADRRECGWEDVVITLDDVNRLADKGSEQWLKFNT